MKTALTWTVAIAAAWLAVHWLSGMYDSGSPSVDGEAITGTGWAPPLIFRHRVYAWSPPYGVPHEGGAA